MLKGVDAGLNLERGHETKVECSLHLIARYHTHDPELSSPIRLSQFVTLFQSYAELCARLAGLSQKPKIRLIEGRPQAFLKRYDQTLAIRNSGYHWSPGQNGQNDFISFRPALNLTL